MKLGVRQIAVGLVAVLASAGGLIAAGHAALAAAPPWEPDPNSIGSLAFYDAAGNVVTSGSINDAPFASYVLASAPGRAGDTKATLFGYLPKEGTATGAWSGEALTASTAYPNSSAPAPLKTSTLPLVTVTSADETIAGLIADFPNTATDAYKGLYQLRVKTSGTGQPPGATYDSADISISGTTWTQVYPAVAQSTTTTLAVTPASPSVQGTTLTLKATVTPTAAAGTVKFFDGATQIGSSVAVSGGVAQTTTSSLSVGTHSLTATFTPTDSTAFASSTSSADSYTISAAATTTTTALGVTPASPVAVGTSVTLKATLTPSSAVGAVQFFDGVTALGSPVAVSGGVAQLVTSSLAAGTHSLTAKFTPTDPTAFTQSTSTAVSYTLTSPATATTTTLAVTPAGPVSAGTVLTLKATVSPSAAGTVSFFDGVTKINSAVTLVSGIAQTTTSTLAVGTHSLTAAFTPTNPAAFTASTSAATSLTVDAITTTTTLGVTPASPVTQGASVTLKATLTPTAVTGTVQFFDGVTALGSPVTVSAGAASLPTTALSVGAHSLSAKLTPSSANYLTSTSATVAYTVNAPVAGSTTTSLGVSPTGPVVQGTSVTLTATVAPSTAAGSVQFLDGASPLGSPVTVSSGKAVLATAALGVGAHSLSAAFTPSNSALFNPSSSAAVSLTVNAPAVATTTTLVLAPASPVTVGTSVTFTATVAPSTAAGTVQFLDGTKLLGSVAVSGGTAVFTSSSLAVGTHALSAKFVPSDAAAFKASAATSQSYVIKSAPAVTTTTVLVVTPATPVIHGTAVTFAATVSPSTAAGKVEFKSGSTVLATVTVSGGSASFTTKALSVGTHLLTATFVPANASAYTTSTSVPPASLTVQKSSTQPAAVLSVTLANGDAVKAGATLAPGTTIVIHGTGFDAAEQVTVTVHSTVVELGTVVSDGLGDVTATVKLPATLAAGSHLVVLTGADASGSFAFIVKAAPASSTPVASTPTTANPSNALPHTGSGMAVPLAVLGFILMIAGAVVIGVARRTRTR